MNSETPISEPARPNLTFIRPGNQDSKQAFYAPERDVALQGTRIMGEVELLVLGDRFDAWRPVYEALRGLHKSELSMEDELRKAGKACVEYVADCWGKVYEPGKGLVDWPTTTKRLSFDEAIGKLRQNAPPAALQFIMMLQGYFLMDFYFAGVGQAMQVGLELDRSSQEVYSMFDAMTRHLWTGETPEKQMVGDFRKLVAAALQVGITSGTLHAVVDSEIAKV